MKEKLIKNFNSYIDKFDENNPFSGPSEYFYINKIIKETKNPDYNIIFSKNFIEWIYATLAAWGMHRMGPDNKGAKMNDFDSFYSCILDNRDIIIELNKFKIEDVDIDNIIKDVKELYLGLWPLMKSNSKLVATSKVMHFLLPHLILPMDREYTMKFFKKTLPTIKSKEDSNNIEKEFLIFEHVLREVNYISKHVDCSKYVDEYFSSTIPKIIDNAIVSYVRDNK